MSATLSVVPMSHEEIRENRGRALTERQRMVLEFIRDYSAVKGYPPTVREIGTRMNIRSTNGVMDHLKALERKGYLQKTDMRARGLRIVSPFKSENSAPQDANAVLLLQNKQLKQMVVRALNAARGARMPDVEDWRVDQAVSEISRELAALDGVSP